MSAREAFRRTRRRVSATLVGETPAQREATIQATVGTDSSVIFLDGILCTALRRGSDRPLTTL